MDADHNRMWIAVPRNRFWKMNSRSRSRNGNAEVIRGTYCKVHCKILPECTRNTPKTVQRRLPKSFKTSAARGFCRTRKPLLYPSELRGRSFDCISLQRCVRLLAVQELPMHQKPCQKPCSIAA